MNDCYDDSSGTLRTLTSPLRNNYFYGKLLDEGHFKLEQWYFMSKRWTLNRLTLGSGIVCGLELHVVDGKLVVESGAAIDGLGREIVMPSRQILDPRQVRDDCGRVVKTIDGEGVVT